MQCRGGCTNVHDGSLIQRDDGKWFRFAGSWGMSIFTSDDFLGPWDSVGTALDNNTDRWAPDVHKVGNLYYLYYSISTWGTQNSHIGVATSPSLEPGTWTDLGSTGVASRDGSRYNAIDGNLFQDGDGSFLLTFGSFWGNTYQVPLTSPEPTRANGNPYNIQFNSTGSQSSEGPYLFKFGEWYYLFWSSGQCCKYDTERPRQGEEYKIMCSVTFLKYSYFSDDS
ncbi:Glycoside hydrolase family 43 [Macrophomina phaseolina MS6]|uniref:Endo-1,5-alpha-L-arabinanase A n=1 Tax=Macrophomina phaseolina (strain MS6) TaxID=1126212 RepID=K2S1B5_MACPH|nr:Glycoside hydrolase family 43 [Macrophomina phaseolina MS6]